MTNVLRQRNGNAAPVAPQTTGPLAAEIAALETQLAGVAHAASKGRPRDLARLEVEVMTLCEAVLAEPAAERQTHLWALRRMVASLDEAALALQQRCERLTPEAKDTRPTGEMMAAYTRGQG